MGNVEYIWTLRFVAACFVPLLVVFAVAACGGGGSSSPATGDPSAFDTQAALDEVAGTEPAEGVDAAVWDELTAELERSITARGTAAAPAAGTQVDDLAADYHPDGSVELTWTYHNAGDYDLNGMVNVSDLTPIGIYFGITENDEEWPQAVVADDDRNGLIDVATSPSSTSTTAQI